MAGLIGCWESGGARLSERTGERFARLLQEESMPSVLLDAGRSSRGLIAATRIIGTAAKRWPPLPIRWARSGQPSPKQCIWCDPPRELSALWDVPGLGGLQLIELDMDDCLRMRELMWKYGDLPMDLADAALVRIAERERVRRIFTVDRRDFGIYRPYRLGRCEILPRSPNRRCQFPNYLV